MKKKTKRNTRKEIETKREAEGRTTEIKDQLSLIRARRKWNRWLGDG